MTLENILHMNIGDGDLSYANNSFLQEIVIQKAQTVLEHTIKGMANNDFFLEPCFMIADLGCSSGKNSLSVVSKIIDIVHGVCQEKDHESPQFQVCLNDLFGNDFNTVFKLIPDFYNNLMSDKGGRFGPCFISVVPGSFYGRLFPDRSLHFVHSSYSIQWLSQVPEGLETNKQNIYMGKTSPLNVLEAYGRQFRNDFTKFLQLRSEEVVRGGCMVLTLPGRNTVDPTSDDCCCLWELLARSLWDMHEEGLVRESDIYSFNFPFYNPYEDELRNIIQHEGSFCLNSMNVFEANWDPHDTDYTNTNDSREVSHTHGKNTANLIRAVIEPLLTCHFGDSIIDMLFNKYGEHVARHLVHKKARHTSFVISLTKI